MRRLKLADHSLDSVIHAAAGLLAQGVPVAYPTDTLYGLGVDPRREDGVARLFELKGRTSEKAIPLIAADLAQVGLVAEITPLARQLARSFWPGPLTLVLTARPGLASGVLGVDGTVAIRVPDHPIARTLAGAVGHPITSTSANASAAQPTGDPDEVVRTLPSLEMLVDAGPAPGGLPSTIVDATAAAPRLVRVGAVPWERVLESLGSASTNVP